MKNYYDVVVAGAGAAGCILGARIAQHGKNPKSGSPLRVAMIEAGPYLGAGKNLPGYGQPDRRRKNSFLNYEMDSRYLWPYGMVKAVGGSVMHWGTHAVIDHVFFDDDYLAWHNTTGVDWNKENFSDAIDETRLMWNLKPAPSEMLTRGNQLFIEAAGSLGHDAKPLAIGRNNCLFCGRCGRGHFCKYDAKTTSQSYIDLALDHGVEIIPEAEIQKVIIEQSSTRPVAQGLVISRNGQLEEIRAAKVIVSCGITGTPMLLYRSGYGPGHKVTAPLIVENHNVGMHFESDFQAASLTALWDEPIKSADGTSAGGSFIRKDWGSNGEGRLILHDFAMGAITYPHEAAVSRFAPPFGKQHKEFMKSAVRRIGGLYPFVGKPGVYGEVGPTGAISYDQRQPQVPELLKWAAEITDFSTEILKKMGAVSIEATPIKRISNYSLAHTAGTCRAGVDPANSVINPYFESHDVENLFICDASAVPRQQQYGAMPTVAVASFAWRRIVSRHFN